MPAERMSPFVAQMPTANDTAKAVYVDRVVAKMKGQFESCSNGVFAMSVKNRQGSET